MSPRPPVPPKPPPRALKAMESGTMPSERLEILIFRRFLKNLKSGGGWSILILHYAIVLLLLVLFWRSAMHGQIPHPEVLIKLVGAYCFLVGSIVIPLTAHELFPSPGETDQAFETVPVGSIVFFDARLRASVTASMFALLPLLPLFIMFDPFLGRDVDPLEIIPFFIGVVSSIWVYFLMELVSIRSDPGGRLARRLGVVAAFILLHLGFVGLVGRLGRVFLQQTNVFKLLIDINPFSQFYILMEGPSQRWLLLRSDFLSLIDYRLYLLILQILVLALSIAVHRAVQKQVYSGPQ